MTETEQDLTLADVPQLRSLRDGAVKHITERQFKQGLEALEDLKAYLMKRRIHKRYFWNMVREILVISRDMSGDPALLPEFEIYFRAKWRRD